MFEVRGSVDRLVAALWEVLAQQSIDVLDRAAAMVMLDRRNRSATGYRR